MPKAKGILTPARCPLEQDAMGHLLQYLESQHDGGTTSDSAVAARLFPVVIEDADDPAAALKVVLDLAWEAACQAFNVYGSHPNLLRKLTATISGMRPSECLVIPIGFMNDLNTSRLVMPRREVFNAWLISGPAEEAELQADVALLLTEMRHRGEVDSDGLTEAGLVRLAMNARSDTSLWEHGEAGAAELVSRGRMTRLDGSED